MLRGVALNGVYLEAISPLMSGFPGPEPISVDEGAVRSALLTGTGGGLAISLSLSDNVSAPLFGKGRGKYVAGLEYSLDEVLESNLIGL